ncbi:MAG: HD-GYP domain-containing protein [Candidatus Omnitrophica bacterium]|nr:HD-GYP domain-containing protein [Candidatus Omnitrophota bacterium]
MGKHKHEAGKILLEVSRAISSSLDPDEVSRLYHKMKSLFLSTVTSLTRAINVKDSYTSGHSERVMKYALAIGREMVLDDQALENLGLASLLHDIGKIGVKESILMKPAKLLGHERQQMRMHPDIGARIVESIDGSNVMRRGIFEHHERYDGKGYPNRLKGDQISIEGRIIAVADVFDALTTDRPYQKGDSEDYAFQKITRESSSQFDPQVVAAFVISYKSHPEIWRK